MKPPIFDYVVADSVEGAIAALAVAGGEAKIIAGGQSLVPMLNFRLAHPRVLVDINRLKELAFIEETPHAIRVGALTRHFTLETSPVIAAHLPVLTAAMQHVAHLAIRNRGTIGGSLSHADPAAELPMMALLLDAKIKIRSPAGERAEHARDFFRSALTTSLASDEIVTEIVFPKLVPQSGWAFREVARRDGDFAIASVAAVFVVRGGRISEARIALTGVGDTPLRAPAAEALLAGKNLDDRLLADVVSSVRAALSPNTDLHASADYRRHLAGVLVSRVVTEAWRRGGGV